MNPYQPADPGSAPAQTDEGGGTLRTVLIVGGVAGVLYLLYRSQAQERALEASVRNAELEAERERESGPAAGPPPSQILIIGGGK